MGEYADMAIEQEMALAFDRPSLTERDLREIDMEDEDEQHDVFIWRNTFMIVRLSEVLHETEKAWLVKFKTGYSDWFPKKNCTMLNGNKLAIPLWLTNKKMAVYEANRKKTP